jgi:transposase
MSPTYTVAIDLSKHKHTATILEVTTGEVCKSVTIPVNAIGFQQFEAALGAVSSNPNDFIIGCEATGHYGETLLRRLQDQGYSIVRMNPAQVVQFRRGLGRHAKTDALDADAMAKQLAISEWTPEQPIQETARRLQSLTRLRLDFVEEQSRWINRVRGLVNQIYPELEPLLKKITSPTSLAVLTHFPSRLLLGYSSLDDITALVKKASRGGKSEAFARQL